MKKLILIILTLPQLLFAQSYKSIFNQHSSLYYSIFGANDKQSSPISINDKDSIFSGRTWKMMEGSTHVECFGFVSEDTLSGKVWFKSIGFGPNSPDTAIKLVADYSLNLGDSFLYHVKLDYWMGTFHYKDSSSIWLKVDSVFYKNGLKHIRFDTTTGFGIRLYMIEGVGTNFLPSYMSVEPVYIQCCYKSGNLFYLNHYSRVPDKCDVVLSDGIDDIFNSNSKTQKVYPNPSNNFISISNLKNGRVEIINSLGQLILTTSQTENINIENLPSGIYWIRFSDEINIIKNSKFIKQ